LLILFSLFGGGREGRPLYSFVVISRGSGFTAFCRGAACRTLDRFGHVTRAGQAPPLRDLTDLQDSL